MAPGAAMMAHLGPDVTRPKISDSYSNSQLPWLITHPVKGHAGHGRITTTAGRTRRKVPPQRYVRQAGRRRLTLVFSAWHRRRADEGGREAARERRNTLHTPAEKKGFTARLAG